MAASFLLLYFIKHKFSENSEIISVLKPVILILKGDKNFNLSRSHIIPVEYNILTSHKNDRSSEEIFPNEPMLAVQEANTDVVIPHDVNSDVAGESVGDVYSKSKQTLYHRCQAGKIGTQSFLLGLVSDYFFFASGKTNINCK